MLPLPLLPYAAASATRVPRVALSVCVKILTSNWCECSRRSLERPEAAVTQPAPARVVRVGGLTEGASCGAPAPLLR